MLVKVQPGNTMRLFVLLACVLAETVQIMTRKEALLGTCVAANAYQKICFSKQQKTNILIVGFGPVAHSIINLLKSKKTRNNFHIVSTTTKPKRVHGLQELVDEVVVIPQLENKKDDVALQDAVFRSDVIFIADAVRMFSVHSFMRTALRVANHIHSNQWKGYLGMVSTENAYGCVLTGEALCENSPVFPNLPTNGNSLWHVNPSAMASVIRLAEASVADSLVVRSAGIWDTTKFANAVLYTAGRSFPACVGDSYFSFCTASTIARFLLWGMERNKRGVYNLAASGCMGLTRRIFYERVHSLYGSSYVSGVHWDDKMEFDTDKLFCTDPDPFLPTSQRSNSQLDCRKAMRDGFTV